jgi:hypothetical protein
MTKPSLRTSLVVVLAFTVTQVYMLAQSVPIQSAQAESRGNGRAIEGVWDQSVTVRQCETGDPIGSARSMSMFNRGGTLTETSNSFHRGSSLGTWLHVGGRSYATAWKLFRFGADGSYAGSTRVRQNLELSDNADEYTSAAVGEVFNPADELVFTFCATGTATRLE